MKTENFTKVVHPCDYDCQGNGRKYPVFCKINYENGRFSITGVIGPTKFGNCMGGCGQIDMEFAHQNPADDDARYNHPVKPSELRFVVGWDAAKWLQFLDIWHLWHLNDLHSGCEHQRKLRWEKDGYDKHPSEPCPICGYKFGTNWHTISVPKDVLNFIKSLPETDRKPNWI